MAVNLSPVGGVAAQFFDNAGNVLTGGKLYTYLAGTTTPQPAYTTSAGNVPWSNPIILDAAGRVSGSGEIWLTDGIQYKFILRDSNDVLIATYDNIIGINSNFVNFTNQQEIQTATAGQTVFNLTTMQYQLGTDSLSVFVDGVNQYGPGAQYAYVETDSDTVTFVNGLHVGASVKFTTSQLNTSGGLDAQQVSYNPPFTGGVATNVEAKLSEYVSVKDFGAVGDGVVDDTAAIQSALNNKGNIYIPAGTYKITSTITLYGDTAIFGDGPGVSIIKAFGITTGNIIQDSSLVSSGDVNLNIVLRDFELDCNSYATGSSIGIEFYRVGNLTVDNLYLHDCGNSLFTWGKSYLDTVNINISNCRFEKARTGDATGGAGRNVNFTNCYAFSIGDTCYATLYDTNATTNPSSLFPQNISYINCTAIGEWVNGVFTGAGRDEQAGFAFGPYDVAADIYVTISNCTAENLYTNVFAAVFDKLKLVNNNFKAAAALDTGGVRLDGIRDAIINDNCFEASFVGTTNNYQALLIQAGTFVYGASTFIADIRHHVVDGNLFLGNSTPAVQFNNLSTTATVVTDVSVSNNVFAGNTLPIDFSPADGNGTNIYSNITVANNTVNAVSTAFVNANGVGAQYLNVMLFNNNIGDDTLITGTAGSAIPIVGTFKKQITGVADNVATTIYTFGSDFRTIEVIAYVETNNAAFMAAAQIVNNLGSLRIVWQSNGANCTLALSGSNLQVTQSGIGAQTVTVIVKNLSY
jgi:hypothetical protein